MASSLHGRISDMEILRRISNKIYIIPDCRQLAIRLGLPPEIVDSLQEESRKPNAIALGVFTEWHRSNGFNGQTLYDALNTDTFKYLAKTFEQDLLPTSTFLEKYKIILPLILVCILAFVHTCTSRPIHPYLPGMCTCLCGVSALLGWLTF